MRASHMGMCLVMPELYWNRVRFQDLDETTAGGP
jgi:hypothetical protein